jgi:hypothetical protein
MADGERQQKQVQEVLELLRTLDDLKRLGVLSERGYELTSPYQRPVR